MIAISLGWGVQSFTMAAMVALGELPLVDVAIFADTTHERSTTYDFAQRWMPWLAERGVEIVTVTPTDRRINPVDSCNTVVIPAFTATPTVRGGQLRRQCTGEWKIMPIRRWLQVNRHGQSVEQWIGISLDEALRMRDPDVKYIHNHWPLIEKRMTRLDCMLWLTSHGLEIPYKSACVFCPFQKRNQWHDLKASDNGDWQKAVETDRAIRKARPPYDLFIHPARIPLEDVDLRTVEEKGQLRLWDEECTGLCGV